MDFKDHVSSIITNIGGSENISNASHCVTRLRLILVDESLVNKEALEENELVKGTFSANGQFQVIIGPGLVEKVYNEFVKQTDAEEVSKDEMKKINGEKGNIVQKGVRVLADIF
ncbi:glucose PTS transporter subunit EIIB, partial [Peribacillus simplex]